MARFLKRFVLFIVFASIIYVSLLVIFEEFLPGYMKPNIRWEPSSRGHLYTRMQDLDTVKAVDILVLGSSHAYRGFDPRIFCASGYNIFVLGSSAQTPLQTARLAEKFIPKLKPKLVLYEAYPRVIGYDGIESTLDFLANDDLDLSLAHLAISTRNIMVVNTLLYSFFKKKVFRKSHQPESKVKVYEDGRKDIYVPGGYVSSKDVNRLYQEERITVSINNTQLAALRKTVAIAKNNNSDIVFVYAPVTQAHYQAISDNDLLSPILNTYGTYIDFNKKLKLNDTLDFRDAHHLNQSGVKKFNDSLMDTLGLN